MFSGDIMNVVDFKDVECLSIGEKLSNSQGVTGLIAAKRFEFAKYSDKLSVCNFLHFETKFSTSKSEEISKYEKQ